MNKRVKALIDESIKKLLVSMGLTGLALASSFVIPVKFSYGILLIAVMLVTFQFTIIGRKLAEIIESEPDEHSINIIEYSNAVNKKNLKYEENKKNN